MPFTEVGESVCEMQECKGKERGMELGFRHFHWDVLQ